MTPSARYGKLLVLATIFGQCMSQICLITGKKPLVGNNVSHANNKTKRRQNPNLQSRLLVNPATGRKERVMISTRGLRTLRKWMAEGKAIDILTVKVA